MPTDQDFQIELNNILETARSEGLPYIDVNSGDLHRRLGGYPGTDHRMPICCRIMNENMRQNVNGNNDIVLRQPPRGQGIITIRYFL